MALSVPSLWGSCRLVFVCCAFLSLLACFVQRFSLSFAVVCMVRQPDDNGTDPSPADDLGELDWDRSVTEWLLSAFFYGYLASQLVGGWASDRTGGRACLVLGNGVQSLLALVLPVAARWCSGAVFAVRLLQGVACGFFLPAVFRLFSFWTLPSERTSLLALVYVGVPLSFVLTFPLSGLLCHYMSWSYIFYITGLFGVACSLLTYCLVHDSPDTHPRIAEDERTALRAATPPQPTRQRNIPLRAILLSGAVNANHVANFCYNWGFNTVATNLPIFLQDVLEVDVRKNGVFSALPYIGLMSARLAIAAGFVRCMAATQLRLTAFSKLNHTLGALGAGACVLGLAALPSGYQLAAVLLVAASQMLAELCYTGGFLRSFMELAPNHVGLLSGWTNAVGAAAGLLSPTIIGVIAKHGSRDEWNMVLYVTAGFYLLGAVVYLALGSSDTQPWNTVDVQQTANVNQTMSDRQPLLAAGTAMQAS